MIPPFPQRSGSLCQAKSLPWLCRMKCSSEGDITLHCSSDLQAAPPLMGPVHLNVATGCKNKQTHAYPPVPLLQAIPEMSQHKEKPPFLPKGQLWTFSPQHNH